MSFQKKWVSAFVLLVFFCLLCLWRKACLIVCLDDFVYEHALKLSLSGAWLNFWYVVSLLGNGFLVRFVAFMLFVFLFWQKRNFQVLVFFVLLFLCFVTVPLVKEIFMIERPVGFLSYYADPTSFSFPSGHTFNGVLLFYFLPRMYEHVFFSQSSLSGRSRVFFSKIFYVSAAVILGMSRVYLGVHWFSDVLGGLVLGSLWCLVLTDYLERISR